MCKTLRINFTHTAPARILVFTVVLALAGTVCAQNKATDQNSKARQVLDERGEIEIRFVRTADMQMEFLTGILSVDRIHHDTLYAYLNEDGFRKFLSQNIPYEILPAPALKKPARVADINRVNWRTHYPSYFRYLALMDSFAVKYPGLCHLTDMATTPGGHKMLAMKISSPSGSDNNKPAVLLTSSIHGDEPLGFVLLLRLIETLLNQYGNSDAITSLVENVEIWINPLANPDGMYFVSDSSVFGATRFNANHVDLNRNFPDPVKGEHPDSYDWQAETVAMMNFMKSIHLVLAANLHGGSEVVNYPWDSNIQLHPDDEWYRKISRQWVDTAHNCSYPGYMTAEDNGITNGYSWYVIYGGRQDYVNYFLHGREVTIELSNNKKPDENDLDDYWKYNYRSILQYIEQACTGISGIIRDSLTGMPVKAMISIAGHDKDNSHVYSDSINGYYCRLAGEGNYVIDISAINYDSKQISVAVRNGLLTRTEVKLSPQKQFLLYPNPFSNVLRINISDPGKDLQLEFMDLSGRKAKHITKKVTAAGRQEIGIEGLAPGMYIVEITYGDIRKRETILKIR